MFEIIYEYFTLFGVLSSNVMVTVRFPVMDPLSQLTIQKSAMTVKLVQILNTVLIY